MSACSAGDTGLCLLAEHCHRLKSLNLCETLVTDEGLLVSVSFYTLYNVYLVSCIQAVCNVYCTVYNVLYKLYVQCDVHFTVYTCYTSCVQYTMCTQCILYIVYTVYCPIYSIV